MPHHRPPWRNTTPKINKHASFKQHKQVRMDLREGKRKRKKAQRRLALDKCSFLSSTRFWKPISRGKQQCPNMCVRARGVCACVRARMFACVCMRVCACILVLGSCALNIDTKKFRTRTRTLVSVSYYLPVKTTLQYFLSGVFSSNSRLLWVIFWRRRILVPIHYDSSL